MPCHATSNHIMTQMQTLMQALKMNAIAMTHDTFLPKIPIAPCYCQMMG